MIMAFEQIKRFKNIKLHILLFGIAVLLITSFIFGNSFKDYETSQKVSDKIATVIAPDEENLGQAVDSMKEIGGKISTVTDHNEYPQEISIGFVIRLFAHLIEFGALGVAVMGLVLSVKREWGKGFFGFGFFYVLAVAVLDEYIQSFSDRSSSIGDVLLDFSGALLGFALTAAVFYLILWIKARKSNKIKAKA